MKPHLPLTLVAYSLAGLLAFPPLGFASAGKKQQAVEHESVEVEHRATQEKQEFEHNAIPEVSRIPEEQREVQQHVTKEHKEIHRDLQEQGKESHHHDD
jgi:hypothetical protein